MDKVDYVRSAEMSSGHLCHWPGCPLEVKPAVWGCRKHWFMLPPHLRRKIWKTFHPGQEISKTPSKEYLEAAREVQNWVTEQRIDVV